MDSQLSTERWRRLYDTPLPWALLAALLAIVAVAWGWQWFRQQVAAQSALPVYGRVGDFTFTERSGQPFGLSDLRGQVWIVNFFFSKCTDVCLRTMPEMARLQDALTDQVQLVSITVDPESDSPAALTQVAARLNARPGRWFFLTGDQKAIYDLALKSFYLSVEQIHEGQIQGPGDAFLHGAHFVLVDRQAQIRGYYDGLDGEALARLVVEARQLLRVK